MSQIETLIEEMKLKRALLGGFDKESVYLFIKELYSLHQDEISNLSREKDALEAEINELRDNSFQMKEETEQLNHRLEEELLFHEEFNHRFDTLAKAIELVHDSKNWVIEDTKKTAASILEQANKQLEDIRQECSFQQKRRDAIVSQIAGAAKQFDSSMEELRSNLYSMLGEAETLRKETSTSNSMMPEDDVCEKMTDSRENESNAAITFEDSEDLLSE